MVWVLKKAGSLLGYDVVRKAKSDRIVRHLERFFAAHPIDLVLDCGGDTGQFGAKCREAAYASAILSFEPLAGAFAKLAERAQRDGNWRALQTGLGETAGVLQLNVSSGDTGLSSAFDAEPAMTARFPELVYGSKEQVPVRRLDDVLAAEMVGRTSRIFLKSDTQGYDLHVLKGLGDRMPQIAGLLIEMSVIPLYRDAPSHWQTLEFARQAGFEPYGFATITRDDKGGMIEYDAIFRRREDIKRG